MRLFSQMNLTSYSSIYHRLNLYLYFNNQERYCLHFIHTQSHNHRFANQRILLKNDNYLARSGCPFSFKFWTLSVRAQTSHFTASKRYMLISTMEQYLGTILLTIKVLILAFMNQKVAFKTDEYLMRNGCVRSSEFST